MKKNEGFLSMRCKFHSKISSFLKFSSKARVAPQQKFEQHPLYSETFNKLKCQVCKKSTQKKTELQITSLRYLTIKALEHQTLYKCLTHFSPNQNNKRFLAKNKKLKSSRSMRPSQYKSSKLIWER